MCCEQKDRVKEAKGAGGGLCSFEKAGRRTGPNIVIVILDTELSSCAVRRHMRPLLGRLQRGEVQCCWRVRLQIILSSLVHRVLRADTTHRGSAPPADAPPRDV